MFYYKLINHQVNPSKFAYLQDPTTTYCELNCKPYNNSKFAPKNFIELQHKYLAKSKYCVLHQRIGNNKNIISHVVSIIPNSLALKQRQHDDDPFLFKVDTQVVAFLDSSKQNPFSSNPNELVSLAELLNFKPGSIQNGYVRFEENLSIQTLLKSLPTSSYTLLPSL